MAINKEETMEMLVLYEFHNKKITEILKKEKNAALVEFEKNKLPQFIKLLEESLELDLRLYLTVMKGLEVYGKNNKVGDGFQAKTYISDKIEAFIDGFENSLSKEYEKFPDFKN
jgi:hypothetical protein